IERALPQYLSRHKNPPSLLHLATGVLTNFRLQHQPIFSFHLAVMILTTHQQQIFCQVHKIRYSLHFWLDCKLTTSVFQVEDWSANTDDLYSSVLLFVLASERFSLILGSKKD